MGPRGGCVGILLCALLGAALGSRARCFECGGGGPGGGCAQSVTTCGEGERCGFVERTPQAGLGQLKLNLTLKQHQPACVAIHRCNQVETESVGDLIFTTHRDCCVGDLCNSALPSTLAPTCVLAAAVSTLAWLLAGLWVG